MAKYLHMDQQFVGFIGEADVSRLSREAILVRLQENKRPNCVSQDVHILGWLHRSASRTTVLGILGGKDSLKQMKLRIDAVAQVDALMAR